MLADLSLLRLELFLVDLAARVPLPEDVQGGIGPGLATLGHQPADAENEAYYDKAALSSSR